MLDQIERFLENKWDRSKNYKTKKASQPRSFF